MNAISVLSTLSVTGVVFAFGDVGEAAADAAIGPGPTDYTAQPQPAPGACHYRTAANGQTLPDPDCTPGAISPKVTQDTLATTICRTGYTKSIRPPASITEIEKRENAAVYGYTGSLKDVEYDHLVPLELGGDPNDPRNLWINPVHPQTRKTASNLGCISLSAKAQCHSLRRRMPSLPIGLRHLTQSVEVEPAHN